MTATATKSRRVELILQQLDSLPTLPAVAARLIQLTSQSDTNARQVISLIESDPSLTAKILSMIRKASLGITQEAATVDKAVVLLGFDAIRSTVLAIKVFEVFGPGEAGTNGAGGFNRAEFWKHCLAVGTCAQMLARESAAFSGRVDPEEAFVCGLLHDIGKVALDASLPKSYERVIMLADQHRACIADVERKLFDIDHAVVGKRIAERWQLPESIVESVWLHHLPPDSLPQTMAHRELVGLVYLADLIARQQWIGYSGNYTAVTAAQIAELSDSIGIKPTALEQSLKQLRRQIEQRAEWIGLSDIDSESLYHQAINEANSQLSSINSKLQAANVQLRQRAGYFDLLCGYHGQLWPAAKIFDLLKVAAAVIGKAMNSERIGCFSLSSERTGLHGLVCDGIEKIIASIVSDDAPEDLQDRWFDQSTPVFRFRLADDRDSWLINRMGSALGGDTFWMLPLLAGGRLVGGIVVSAPENPGLQADMNLTPLEALCGGIALSLANTAIAEQQNQLAEDLAEANRKLTQTHEALLEARSMVMVGEMAAGAGHEINNPLAVISGRSQLLLAGEKDQKRRAALTAIQQNSERISEIVTELMSFARPATPEKQSLKAHNWLPQVAQQVIEALGDQQIQLTCSIADELPEVIIDPEQLKTVLTELFVNAAGAYEQPPCPVELRAGHDEVEDCLHVEIIDEGKGMGPEVLGKAFEPFYSAKPAGRSRGLGLARAYRLTRLNGGRIWLTSEPSKGTCAHLALPLARNRPIEET